MSIQATTLFTRQLLFRDQLGIAANPDVGPTATLYIDGAVDPTIVTITSLNLPGQYTYSFVVPNSVGSVASVRVQASYSGQTAIDETESLGSITEAPSPGDETPLNADRKVYVLKQGRIVTSGLGMSGQYPILYLDEDEKLSVSVDWSEWLGTDMISSVENETTLATVSNPSNTTTTASFLLNSRYNGYLDHRITTAAGQVKELKIMVKVKQDRPRYDYPQSGVVW